ncbi:hypothetical protein BXY75_2881 [Ulvibacter antarcticus]|uniref:Uncharacterized protein n=1 Tax=Ulvibacter antarcticus TaxID=442714 RepID=A0A3L9YBF7_9FLAO|nr:hypothetical protein BXY75_2881 [Ulvibacter antarcticus]
MFFTKKDLSKIDRKLTICEFKEMESTFINIERTKSDKLN